MAFTLDQLWTTLKERFSGLLPVSYEVGENIDGGCVFMAHPTKPGKVTPCTTAEGANWLGIAKYFAAPSDNWAESGGNRVRGLVANEPIPNKVAGIHIGFYDIVNSGTGPVAPGQAVYVVNNDGRIGRPGTIPTDPRAVVGTCVGLATGEHGAANAGSATNVRSVPAGSKMRIRVGRG